MRAYLEVDDDAIDVRILNTGWTVTCSSLMEFRRRNSPFAPRIEMTYHFECVSSRPMTSTRLSATLSSLQITFSVTCMQPGSVAVLAKVSNLKEMTILSS
jgi:hypothetical protein